MSIFATLECLFKLEVSFFIFVVIILGLLPPFSDCLAQDDLPRVSKHLQNTGQFHLRQTLDFGEPINDGILKGKRLDLSVEGKSCLYQAELPNGITDIALLNIQSNIKLQRRWIFCNPNRTWNSDTTYGRRIAYSISYFTIVKVWCYTCAYLSIRCGKKTYSCE